MLSNTWTTMIIGDAGATAFAGGGAPQEADLDAVMPACAVRMRQSITVRRPPEEVFATLQGLRALCRPFAALLEAPRRLGSADPGTPVDAGPTLWMPLAEAVRCRIVGLVGRLWGPGAGLRAVRSVADLRGFDEPGGCRIAFELSARPARGRGTRLTAEMRIDAVDDATARTLRAHWRVVGLGVHVAVRCLLGDIRRRAERPVH
jgi:hypothetical protein